ncbi:MAG: flagellar hook-associated protein 3 [Gammaproteobacteria bacterium CG22_combo_CG10-13_8_21_14_all_40_8]|nr:MAG: flagellar hook-associated protein 3 [Gammaproteobacteria bacterium CG22_combo_CG10-13_8_21_14_all_40_8]
MRISTTQFNTTGLNSIKDQMSGLLKTQNQLATQKRVQVPSDDPVASAVIFNIQQQIGITTRLTQNAEGVKNFAQQEEIALGSSTNVLQRVRDLLIQGGNGTFSDSDRNALADEVEQRLLELQGLANTKVNGIEYLFSGFQANVKPIDQDSSGTFIYNGDQGQRQVQVGTGVTVSASDSGFDTFFDIRNGNGQFSTSANLANTGNGVIGSGSVYDTAAYLPDNYSIQITTTGSQLQYEVFDGGSASVTGPTNYVDGQAIQFNGISVNLSGTPAVGDSFNIDPSIRQDVFTTVKNIVDVLRTNTSTPAQAAQLQNGLNQSLENMDRAMDKISQVQARVGSRLNVLDNQIAINTDFNLTNTSALSKVQDIDMAEAISRLSQQQFGLEAAQQSFARIQNLSLFNFL